MTARDVKVSETGLEVLKALWQRGPGTVREINVALGRRGRKWAYTTVQTMLNRLAAKGLVECDKSQVPHRYRAAVTREALLKERLDHLADELCEGTATPLVLALVEGGQFSAEELEQFRKLLDRLEE